MAASSKSNHIWPAYVDMMTVLLMVYMLLSMIFQVLAALASPTSGAAESKLTTSATEAVTAAHPAADMDDSLVQQPNDFVATVKSDENFLQPPERAAVRAWMSRNAQAIGERGFLVFSMTGTADAPLGVRLRMQFERSLMVVSIADELKIPRDKIELRNPVPEQATQDSIILRLK